MGCNNLYIFQKHVAKLVDITSEKCKITSNLKYAKIYKLHPIWDVISPNACFQNRKITSEMCKITSSIKMCKNTKITLDNNYDM